MDGSFRIGRLFGIPILIHYTFLIVIPLFAWIIGSQITLTIDMLKEIYQVPIDLTVVTAGLHPTCSGRSWRWVSSLACSCTSSHIVLLPAAKGSRSTTSR